MYSTHTIREIFYKTTNNSIHLHPINLSNDLGGLFTSN